MNRGIGETRRVIGLMCALIMLAGLAVGCGGQGTASPSQATFGSTTTTVYVPSTVYEPPPALIASKSWAFDLTKPDRSSIHVDLKVGEFATLGNEPMLPGTSVGAGHPCKPEAKSDALIPYELTMTSTTDTFDVDIPVNFVLGSFDGGYDIDAEAWYGDGPECNTSSGDIYLSMKKSLSPGKKATLYGYIVLRGYYSPLYPDGDPLQLADAQLRFTSTASKESLDVRLSNATGPGITSHGLTTFPLSGVAQTR